MPVYSKDRINLFEGPEILGWVGEIPFIGCWKYNDTTLFFWCPACQKRHYHKNVSGLVRSDCKVFTKGYYIRLRGEEIRNPYQPGGVK